MEKRVPPIAFLSDTPNEQILDWYVAEYARQGWRVLSHTPSGAQFQKPKEWSKAGIILFVLLPVIVGCLWYPMFGVALIGAVLVIADYAFGKDQLEYLSAAQAKARARQELAG